MKLWPPKKISKPKRWPRNKPRKVICVSPRVHNALLTCSRVDKRTIMDIADEVIILGISYKYGLVEDILRKKYQEKRQRGIGLYTPRRS